MKQVVLILFVLFSGCAPSKEEQAIADYEQVVDLDVISLDKAGTLTAKDSVAILTKMMDSIGSLRMQDLFKGMNEQLNLISKQNYTILIATTKAREDQAKDAMKTHRMIFDSYKRTLSFYERKVYDSTELWKMSDRTKVYQSKSDSILLEKYRCVYAEGNNKITKTYYIKNDKVVYAK